MLKKIPKVGFISKTELQKAETVSFCPELDKVIQVGPNELMLVFTNRTPVSIWGTDPVALLLYLQTPTKSCYTEFKRQIAADLEETQAA